MARAPKTLVKRKRIAKDSHAAAPFIEEGVYYSAEKKNCCKGCGKETFPESFIISKKLADWLLKNRPATAPNGSEQGFEWSTEALDAFCNEMLNDMHADKAAEIGHYISDSDLQFMLTWALMGHSAIAKAVGYRLGMIQKIIPPANDMEAYRRAVLFDARHSYSENEPSTASLNAVSTEAFPDKGDHRRTVREWRDSAIYKDFVRSLRGSENDKDHYDEETLQNFASNWDMLGRYSVPLNEKGKFDFASDSAYVSSNPINKSSSSSTGE